MSQSQAELDRLEAFLDSEQVPEGTMNISTLDGFLTAVAVGPEPIPTEEWVPMIWPDPGPRFADDAQAEEIGSLIAARLEQIQRELGGEPPQCTPVYWLTDNDEEIAFDWAEGFMVGVYLRTEAWMPLIGDESNAEMLMPVLILCEDEDGRPLIELDAEEEGELVDAAPAVIPEMVVEIAQFWKERGPPLQPVRRDGVKVGRNDTCPCGSGKKYKRCCGAN